MSIEALYSLVETDMAAVEEATLQQLQTDNEYINNLSRHIIASGGKRLRPLTLILSARACGYEGENHIPLAMGVEFFHTATLLHDDVIDESAMRRGKSTANEIFGSKSSILVGDFLFTRSFQLITAADNLAIIRLLADTSNAITKGEVLQLLNKQKVEMNEDAYFNVIKHKTGVLFSASAEIGGLLADADESITSALNAYGLHLGNAFQIIDDILDYSSNAEKMGKNIGDDLAEGKPTLPLIYAYNKSESADRDIIKQALQTQSKTNLGGILDIMTKTAALDACYTIAKQEIDAAINALQALPPSQYREGLQQLALFSIEREY